MLPSREPNQNVHHWSGLGWALVLIVGWAGVGWWGSRLPWPTWILLVPFRAWLQTGLFVVAHDAMHGSLLPQQRRWNDRLGSLALWLYAGLSFDHCRRLHQQHHRWPGQVGDPDFHDGQHRDPWAWFRIFMRRYVSGSVFLTLGSFWLAVGWGLHLGGEAWPLCLGSVLFLWILPVILSAWQLFWFGTYLPHRQGIHSLHWPLGWSLMACFHFGYHQEHHRYPHLPWYDLPQAVGHKGQSDSQP
ncbi:MAG: fatty acid desaturase [Synechococcales cyanobacterium]